MNESSRELKVLISGCVLLLAVGASFHFVAALELRGVDCIYLIGELAIIGLSIVLAARYARAVLAGLGILFMAFCVYHILNFGNNCGCFGPDSVSSIWMIIGNLLVALVFLSIWQFNAKPIKAIAWVVPFAGFCILVCQGMFQTMADREVVLLCNCINSRSPFTRLTDDMPSFERDTWEVLVVKRDCEKCMTYLEGELTEIEQGLVVNSSSMYIAVFRAPGLDWQLASVNLFPQEKKSELVSIIPCKLRIEDGIVADCELL